MNMSQPAFIPITILTGFLGSGKTTVLNRALKSPALADCAVLVNEFGEIGLDHLLVESVEDDIVLLQSGCVCCTVQDDLAAALRSLLSRRAEGLVPPFSRIVLETTGVADPVPILQLIAALRDLPIPCAVSNIVTVLDAVYGQASLQAQPEAMRQAAAADTLIVSKTDLISPREVNALLVGFAHFNPDAEIFNANVSEFDAAATLSAVHRASPRKSGVVNEQTHTHGHGFSTYSLTLNAAVEWEEVRAWLDGLLIARGDSIFRIKGLINLSGELRPTVLQVVQHSVYPLSHLAEWPDGEASTSLTFITRNFSRDAALASLRPFIEESVQ